MCQSERIGPLSLPQPQHQIARRDLIGDGKSLAIDLTVAAALRPRLWPKVRADRPLAKLAAKKLEVMRLVAARDGVQTVLEDVRLKLIRGAHARIGILLGTQLPHERERRQAGDLHRRQPRAEGRRLSARLAVAGGAIMSRAPFLVIDGRLYRWKRTFLTCGARSWPPPEPQRQANWRSSQPCTARPSSARRPGAICNRALFENKVAQTRESQIDR
jgi:hypothetical protein